MFIKTIFFICVISVLGLLIARWSNRKYRRLSKIAKISLEKKIQKLERVDSIQSLVSSCGVSEIYEGRMIGVAKVLMNVLNFGDFIPSKNVVMKSLLQIDVWDKKKGGVEVKSMEPYSYDLINSLMEIGDKNLWKEALKNNVIPSSEDDLIEFIMGLTVGEFLKLFTPITRTGI